MPLFDPTHTAIIIVALMGAVLGLCGYLTLSERKLSAWMQDRIGPNRVGPGGLLQPMADGGKFFLKEEVIPSHVDKIFYILAPAVAVGTALLSLAIVPFGATTPTPDAVPVPLQTSKSTPSSEKPPRPPEATMRAWFRLTDQVFAALKSENVPEPLLKKLYPMKDKVFFRDDFVGEINQLLNTDETKQFQRLILNYAVDPVATFEQQQKDYQDKFNFVLNPGLDIGVLYIFALGSIAVYGVILAGWSANNKYSLLGSLRASAQIISYEIPLGMSVLGVFLIVGSLNPERIVAWQTTRGPYWLILFQPLALLLFMTSTYAEANRLPFDLSEAEQELVGGYHTEYSSLKLGLMLLAEYVHLVTSSFMISVLFFGGWSLFGLESFIENPILGAVVKLLVLSGKMVLLCGFAQLIRWTIPRFRFDQLMNLAWKVLFPLALLNLLCVVVVKQFGGPLILLTATSIGLFLGAGLLSVRWHGSVTNPKRKVIKLPPGIPAGVTYAS
ncbi:MAG TPA: complex I subunit 1 family protein [Gemmata sp.]|nr:complex I subunit 1 family protein [Gemmata sp.]